MMEYLKRKFSKLEKQNDWNNKIPFPRYYEDNGKIIKELSENEKFIIDLDENFNETILKRLK